jgi:hypothetical protein
MPATPSPTTTNGAQYGCTTFGSPGSIRATIDSAWDRPTVASVAIALGGVVI